ncbi:DUF2059 domain-containing protein [Sphingomonas jaspsi]|uniref:DUF2059 domain-containing protein n=1 Tax=Sphingomonas jaspsi TaxID=392409 RepID=UPI0004AF6D1A|nr:DUF2059 domain-containing protein [Sphingomonas jaspsi]
MLLAALMMVAAAEPSAEALSLGRELSERGTLATLLTVAEAKDKAEMAAKNPGMSDADKAALEAAVTGSYAAERERLFAADARSFATNLSIEDLRALVAFARTPAAQHLQSAMPSIIASTISQVGQIDLAGAARDSYCKGRETQPLCADR